MISEDEKRHVGRESEWEEKEQLYYKFIHTQTKIPVQSGFIGEHHI